MEASQGGDARAAGVLADGEVTERDGVLLCRCGGLVYVWAGPGTANIEMREVDPAGEAAFGAVLGYVEPTRPQDGLAVAFQADEFLRHCQDITRMAAEAPIVDATEPPELAQGPSPVLDNPEVLARELHDAAKEGGFAADKVAWEELRPELRVNYIVLATRALNRIPQAPAPAAEPEPPAISDEELAREFVTALARDEYERSRQGEPHMPPWDEVTPDERTGSDARGGYYERAGAYVGALPELAALLRQPPAPLEPDLEAERAAALRQETQEKAKVLLGTFARNLLAALEGGASFEEAIEAMKSVQSKANSLLARLIDTAPEREVPDLRRAKAVLVKEDGWVDVQPGTLRIVTPDREKGAFAEFTPGEDCCWPEGDTYLVPMVDVLAMQIPAPEKETPPEAEPVVDEHAPEPATPVESSDPPADPGPEEPAAPQPAPVGDRVETGDGRQGLVVEGPDAEGKVLVRIEGQEDERFGHDVLTKIGGPS